MENQIFAIMKLARKQGYSVTWLQDMLLVSRDFEPAHKCKLNRLELCRLHDALAIGTLDADIKRAEEARKKAEAAQAWQKDIDNKARMVRATVYK